MWSFPPRERYHLGPFVSVPVSLENSVVSTPTPPAAHDSWSNLVYCDRDTSRSLAWLTQRDVQGAGRYSPSEGVSCQVKETFDPELKFQPVPGGLYG